MAVFNEILVGRFSRFAQKHFSMKGRAPTPTLSADVGMTMTLFSGEENRYLQGWDLFARNGNQAAIVGQINLLELRNPPNSGVIAVIEAAQWAQTTATTVATGPFSSLQRNAVNDQNSVITNGALDRRTQRLNSSLIMSQNAAAAPTAIGGSQIALWTASGGANNTFVIFPAQEECPLLPGDAFTIQSQIVNDATGFSLWWRERPLEESERF